MVGGHEHVAFARAGRHEFSQRPPLEVAGEEHTAARRFDRHDETGVVVGSCRLAFSIRCRQRAEHADPTEWIDREGIPGAGHPHGNAAVSRRRQHGNR